MATLRLSPARDTERTIQMLSVFLLILTASLAVSRPADPEQKILFNINDPPAERAFAIQNLLEQNEDLEPGLVQTLISLTPAGTSDIKGTTMDSWMIMQRLAELVERRRGMERTLQKTRAS